MLADQLVLLAPTTDACLFRKHRDNAVVGSMCTGAPNDRSDGWPSRQMP
jgi:hypothetical protein